jgi:HEAT repeat protein
MNAIDKIVRMLSDEATEKRIAAAIVLAELKAKGPGVEAALAALLDSGVPALERHALDALARIGAKRSAARVLPRLASPDASVRAAARRALVGVGEAVVPKIRDRLKSAEGEERRELDAVLAELGGTEAFDALLEAIAADEPEAAKAAAIAVRQRIKSADAPQRKAYLAETRSFLAAQSKPPGNTGAVVAGLKILGYLEDARALPLLVAYAGDAKEPLGVRQEAVIAIRFALASGTQAPASVADVLLDAAADPDRALAQTALHTLGGLELGPPHEKKLEQLARHPDFERARSVLEQLGRQRGKGAAKVLVQALGSSDKRRAEIAEVALATNEAAAPLLAKACLAAESPDQAWRIRNVLRPHAKEVPPPLRKELLAAAMERLEASQRGFEALLDVARDADPDGAAKALRALAQRLKKSGKADKSLTVLGLLCKSDRATDDDRYARATLELARSTKDTRAAARASDEALKQLASLAARGYDVAKALRGDAGVDLEHLYYVGFHFAEEGDPIGAELLEEVVKRGGRAKVARMAKNKLHLSEEGAA